MSDGQTSPNDPLAALDAADRERFEALAPYVDTKTLSAVDAQWLAACARLDAAVAAELARHRGLRAAMQERFAKVPDDIGLARARRQIAALPKAAAPAANPAVAARGWAERLSAWLRPSPAWAVAFRLFVMPLAFIAGRETAPEPTVAVRGTTGLFDGPLVRVNFQPQTPEHVVRETLIEQGALVVGPTRLGDWYAKVAPTRIDAVRTALAGKPAVAAAEVVPALPAELVDQP
jgi:hypothetical protein